MKQRKTLIDVMTTPATTRPAYVDETLVEFQQEQAAERQAQIDALPENVAAREFQQLLDEQNQAIREIHTSRSATLFAGPSPELQARCSHREMYEGTSAEINQKVLQAAQVGMKGVTHLTEAGRAKMIEVLRLNPTIDRWEPKNWKTVYDYILELNQFTKADGVEPPAPIQHAPAPPAPEPTFTQKLDAINTSTRAGEKAARELVKQETKQATTSTYYQFAQQCEQVFGAQFLSDEIAALALIMDARNFSTSDLKAWHTARVLAVRNQGICPTWLTPDEQLTLDIDRGLDTTSFEGRRAFMRRSADIAANTTIIPTYPI